MTQNKMQNDSKLNDFFIEQLKDIYWAEKKLVKTLPKFENASTTQELKNAFAKHLEQSEEHVSRLEKVFELMWIKAEAIESPAMAGIIEEGVDIINDTEEGTAQRDVGLIFAGQKAEHYEIATYGGLCRLAETLGYVDIKNILGKTLQEVKDIDTLLSQIAETNVNYKASLEPAEIWNTTIYI
ncbi:MAG TPA: ferritin-like domain-containing protein [Hanamia sp.]|nr:ferritin-like domain-containing protein [Hanamia sp.]